MSTADLTYDRIAQDVRLALKGEFGADVPVSTEKIQGDKVAVAIASERFDGMTPKKRQDEVWKVIRKSLQERAQRVSLVMVYGSKDLL
jgi:hypothetical protein